MPTLDQPRMIFPNFPQGWEVVSPPVVSPQSEPCTLAVAGSTCRGVLQPSESQKETRPARPHDARHVKGLKGLYLNQNYIGPEGCKCLGRSKILAGMHGTWDCSRSKRAMGRETSIILIYFDIDFTFLYFVGIEPH